MFRSAQHDTASNHMNLVGAADVAQSRARASLVTCRENDVQPHGEKEIYNQDSKRRIHDSFGCSPADADCALARGETFVATNENNQQRENARLCHSHDDVPGPGPPDHVCNVIRAVNVK